MATPTVSTAILTGSTLAIAGANFGIKTTPAPVFFQPYTATTTGQTPFDVGFDTWTDLGGESVDMSQGVGGGSMLFDLTAENNAMPHVGVILPSNTSQVYTNFFIKFIKTGSPTVIDPHIKWTRTAPRPVGATDSGLEDYETGPSKYYASIYFHPADGSSVEYCNAFWNESTGADHFSYGADTNFGGSAHSYSTNFITDWRNMESFHTMNTPTLQDGLESYYVDGQTVHYRPACYPLGASPDYFGFVQPIAGVDIPDTEDVPPVSEFRDWKYVVSRMYVDNTQARVFLAAESTAAAVTKKFLLPPSAWAAGAITATDASSIPSGYNYAYVTNSAGETNTNGRAITGGSSFQPAWARNANQ